MESLYISLMLKSVQVQCHSALARREGKGVDPRGNNHWFLIWPKSENSDTQANEELKEVLRLFLHGFIFFFQATVPDIEKQEFTVSHQQNWTSQLSIQVCLSASHTAAQALQQQSHISDTILCFGCKRGGVRKAGYNNTTRSSASTTAVLW